MKKCSYFPVFCVHMMPCSLFFISDCQCTLIGFQVFVQTLDSSCFYHQYYWIFCTCVFLLCITLSHWEQGLAAVFLYYNYHKTCSVIVNSYKEETTFTFHQTKGVKKATWACFLLLSYFCHSYYILSPVDITATHLVTTATHQVTTGQLTRSPQTWSAVGVSLVKMLDIVIQFGLRFLFAVTQLVDL